ncbi:MAG: FMN-binding negative transcriptional regulator, partial [Gammaproteobacteria bacterium]
MRTAKIFQPKDAEGLGEFIRQQPLASLVSCIENDLEATQLPLLAELDPEGNVVELIGHMARSNRHVEMIEQNPRAIAIFLGAQGHISPSWMRDRTQAPTWNFETAHFIVDVSFVQTQDETAEAVARLLDAMEHGRPNRWHSSELGPRYD